ncbi:MAG: CoA transferase, partial [Dehalococcoidales bacterium]|nr:CoA transferase [Dehalococcoidales bacterium]
MGTVSPDVNSHTTSNGRKALDGVKVIEWSQMVAGPYCAKLLADLGADTIKIEDPGGDEARKRGPFLHDEADPEKSLLFLYLNTNKRGVTLDVHSRTGREKFIELIRWADIFIDDHLSQSLAELKLDYAELSKINPALVMASITPFGQSGPYSNYKAYPLNIWHGGGLGYLSPITEGIPIPLKPGAYWSECACGLVGAVGVVAGLYHMRETGCGQLVDVSKQEAIMGLARVQLDRYPNEGVVQNHAGFPRKGPALVHCKDGYMVYSGTQQHESKALIQFISGTDTNKYEKFLDEDFREDHWLELKDNISKWMEEYPKDWLYHQGQAAGVPIAPVMTVEDIVKSAQSTARQLFIKGVHPVAGKLIYPASACRFSASPASIERAAPLLGEHNTKVFEKPLAPNIINTPKPDKKVGRILEGIRIADFSWAWAGSHATELLAFLGAEVIKIESMNRIDMVRKMSFTTGQKFTGVNSSSVFNGLNLGKLSIKLNLSKPKGIELAKRIVGMSDIVMQNMRPGVMEKLGLSYDTLRAIKPDIVYLSSSTRGSIGPERNYSGYAPNFAALAGISYLCGMPDGEPCAMAGEIDILSAVSSAFALLVGLNHRKMTGEGQHIDLSSTDSSSVLIGDVIMDYMANGRVQTRCGNLDEAMAPHNCYRCKGENKWVSVAVATDEEWQALCKVLGNPDWSRQERFRTAPLRWQNQLELDRLFETWTMNHTHYQVMEKLQTAGVAAVPVFDAEEIYKDPHTQQRHCWTQVSHPVLGPQMVLRPAWQLSATP